MKKRRSAEEQIAYALAQESSVQTIAEICRRLGMSERTFYRWKKRFGLMGVAEVRRLNQLEYKSATLKRLVAYLSIDRSILQDVLRKRLTPDQHHGPVGYAAGCRSGDGAPGTPNTVRFADDGSLRFEQA